MSRGRPCGFGRAAICIPADWTRARRRLFEARVGRAGRLVSEPLPVAVRIHPADSCRRAGAGRPVAQDRRALSGLSRARRRGRRFRAGRAARRTRARSRARAFSCASAGRRRLRHVDPRFEARLDRGFRPCARRRRRHNHCRRHCRALADARSRLGPGDRARRHCRAARRGRRLRRPAPHQSAAPPRLHSRGREPVQRRERAGDLSRRGDRGDLRHDGDDNPAARAFRASLAFCRLGARHIAAAHHGARLGCADGDPHAIPDGLRRLADRRAPASVGRADAGRLRRHGLAHHAHARASPPAVLRGLGDRDLLSQRARLRADRTADRTDLLETRRRRPRAIFAGRRGGSRDSCARTFRLGFSQRRRRLDLWPLARLQPDQSRRAARLARRAGRFMGRYARHRHAGRRARAAGWGEPVPASRSHPVRRLFRRARHADHPGVYARPAVATARSAAGSSAGEGIGLCAHRGPARRARQPRRRGQRRLAACARRICRPHCCR